jgi:hypothetical protein
VTHERYSHDRVLFVAIRVGDNGYAQQDEEFSGLYYSERFFGHLFIEKAVEGVTYEIRTSSQNRAESRYLSDWTLADGEIIWSQRRWLR